MKSRGIKRVVCLLPKSQLDYYEGIPGGLLKLYNNEFGEENVLSAPVEDFHLPEPNKLKQILDFLKNS
ncbi:MAG: protein phosphatase, partial [Candidatus Freyarchaeota archaeon]